MAKRISEQATRHYSPEDGIERQVILRSAQDDSPMPTPQELAQYKEVDPSLVQFFMDLVKEEQKNRHELQRQTIEGVREVASKDYRINRLGMIIVAIITLALLGLSFVLLLNGFHWAGMIFSGSTILMIYAYITQMATSLTKNPSKPPKPE